MITLIEAYGNHSNRLFQNLHFEAFCLENGIRFSNIAFKDMRQYYNSPPAIKQLNYMQSLLFKNKLIYKKLNIFNNIYSFENENNINYKLLTQNKKNIYVRGWAFRVWDLTAKYQDTFITKYSLKPEYFLNNFLCDKIEKIDRNANTIIGVHIRRGDYKAWVNGKYYFSDNIYQLYIDNFDTQLKKDNTKRNIFIIFSNEDISIKSSDSILHSRNQWFIDHYLMSKCDYLIGPPSTFTLWASYIGKKKYFHIENDSGDITLNKFTYCIG